MRRPTAAGPGASWEHAVAVRRSFASVFVLFAAAALIGTAAHVAAQTAPPPAAKAKSPAKKKAPAKSDQDGDADAMPAAKKKLDPAEAQRQIDAGIKLYQEGKAEPAIQMLTSATSGGGLPPQQMGRALYYRGMAYRKAAKPAQAISDLTSALWLKNGLTEADRSEALKQRSEAYREAGLPDQTDSDGRAPGVKSNARSASAGGDAKSPAPAPTTSGNFLASLFGQKSPPPPPPAEPVSAPPAAAASPPHEPATSGWSSKSRPAKAEQPSAAAALAPPSPAEPPPSAKMPRQRTAAAHQAAPAAAPAPPPPTARPDGKFRARVALVRSRPDAEAIVARLRVQHAAAIGDAGTDITEASFGNMGTFFQVRVGPFAHEADASGVCNKLKGSGLDCVPVDR